MGMLKLVIFDLDGTLMDAYRAVWLSINYSLKKMGFPSQNHQIVKRSVGWGDVRLLRGFVGEENLKRALKIYRQHHAKALKQGTKFLPGAKSVLRFLKKRGFRLAVASNRPTRFSLIALKALKIRDYFDLVICADKVKRGKPYPDIFQEILCRLSVKPKEALYVGDMVIDVVAGKKARIRTVIVLTGSSRREEVSVLKPYRIMKSLMELPKVVAGLNS